MPSKLRAMFGFPGFAENALLIGCVMAAFSLGSLAHAADITIDLEAPPYGGVTVGSIERAVNDARRHRNNFPDDNVVIQFPAGRFHLPTTHAEDAIERDRAVIDVSDLPQNGTGWIHLRGRGRGQTTLVFSNRATHFFGRDVHRLSIQGFHFTTEENTVSQGHVVALERGTVTLLIQDGFPTPAEIYDGHIEGRGRFLRRYTDSDTNPLLIENDNAQVPWDNPRKIMDQVMMDRVWKFDVRDPGDALRHYSIGSFVCIKSRTGGQAYWFFGGSDIVFENILWTRRSRGVFRGGIKGVKIIDSAVRRSDPVNGQTPCLSTSEGGPQIGQPNDLPTVGALVRGYNAKSTGDDALAFFNARDSRVESARILDSFARGIYLVASPTVALNFSSDPMTGMPHIILTRNIVLREEREGAVPAEE